MRITLALLLAAVIAAGGEGEKELPGAAAAPTEAEAAAEREVQEASNANLAADLQEHIQKETEKMVESLENAANSNTAGFMEELQKAKQKVSTLSDTQDASLHEVRTEQTETLSRLSTEILEARATEADKFKAVKEITDETKDQASQVDEALESTQDGVEVEITKLHQKQNEFPTAMNAQVTGAQERADAAARKIDTDVKAEITSVKSEVLQEANEMRKTGEMKSADLQAQTQRLSSDLTAMRIGVAKKVNEALQDSNMKQDEVVAQLSTASTESANVREMAYRQNQEIHSKINDESDNLKSDLRQSAGVFQAATDQVQASTQARVTKAKAEVIHKLLSTRDRVSAHLTTALADVESGILAGANGVKMSKKILEESATSLKSQIAENRKQELLIAGQLVDLGDHVRGTEYKAQSALNSTEETVDKLTEAMKEKVVNAINETKAEVDEVSAAKIKIVTDKILNIKKQIGAKITEIKGGVASMVQKADISEQSHEKQAMSMMENVAHVKAAVDAEKKAMEQAVPNMKIAVERAVDSVGADIKRVHTGVGSSHVEVAKEIRDARNQINKASSDRVKSASDNLHQQLEHSEKGLSKMMGGMMNSLSHIQATSAKKYASSAAEQARIESSIENSIDRSNEISEHNDVRAEKLGAEVRQANSELRKAERRESLASKEQSDRLSKSIEAKIGAAEKKGEEKIDAGTAKENERVMAFEKAVGSGIQRDSQNLAQYIVESGGKVADLSDKVKDLDSEVSGRDGDASRKSRQLAEKISELIEDQNMLKSRREGTSEEEHAAITQRGRELADMITEKVGALSKLQDSHIQDLAHQAVAAMEEQATRTEMQDRETKRTVDSWGHRMHDEVTKVQSTVSHTQENLDGFKAAEDAAKEKLRDEVNRLAGQVHDGEQRAAVTVVNEDARAENLLKNEQGGMKGLLQAIQQTQSKFAKHLTGAKDEFASEMDYYTQQGGTKSDSLVSKIGELETKARELATGFAEESQSSKAKLANSQKRLTSVMGQTEDQVSQFKSELHDVRERRAREASQIHQESEELHSQIAQQFQSTLDHIDSMRTGTTHKFDDLSNDQQSYEKELAGMVAVHANKEQQTIDQMKAKITELDANNAQLVEWQDKFKARTEKFRAQVERRVDQLQTPESRNLRQADAGASELAELQDQVNGLGEEHSRLTDHGSSLASRVQRLEQMISAHGLVQ